MNIQELANQVASVKVPRGVIAIDFETVPKKRTMVHVMRENLLESVDMEHLERVGHDSKYDMLKTEINGVIFFCLDKRENHCPCCGGKK